MDIQQFVDLNTRLEPLRRVLADLTTVAQLLPGASQFLQEAETRQATFVKLFRDLDERYQAFLKRADVARVKAEEVEAATSERIKVAERRQVEAEAEAINKVQAAQQAAEAQLGIIRTNVQQEINQLEIARAKAEQDKIEAEKTLNDLVARFK